MLTRLRFLTAGESHGPALVGILEGMPAGLVIDAAALADEMRRRRSGFGRSARMQIEADVVDVKAGLRRGKTLGSPIAFVIENRDHARWSTSMSIWPSPDETNDASDTKDARVTVPRPGHADLAGLQKLGAVDVRDVLERASARETAARVAVGSFCRQLLRACGVVVGSHVVSIGNVTARALDASDASLARLRADEISARADASQVRCVDDDAAARMIGAIEAARATGDTIGGSFEVRADGLPVGLGHFAQWDRRLTSKIAEAIASVHAIRAVSFGDAALVVDDTRGAYDGGGRAFHDAIVADQAGKLTRATNRAGGIEGGMSNGMTLRATATMKPLSTVAGGLPSVDLDTGAAARGHVERSDTCAVPAASVVVEAMVCIVLADALLEKFGGDSLDQLRAHIAATAVYAGHASRGDNSADDALDDRDDGSAR